MKFSTTWLAKYLETTESVDSIAETLTSLGLEVDGVEKGTPHGDVIEIDLTPDRVDCAGVYGIARDLAAKGRGKLKLIDKQLVAGTFKSPVSVTLDFSEDSKTACPLFIGRYIKGVKNCESPAWLKELLESAGLKPISALVDITNYFCLGMCRPLHVFDAAKLTGNIHVRLARKGEKITGLDEQEYELHDSVTVIADDAGAQGIAGILGGLDTGCAMETTDVFLEVAYFDPIRTAFSGRELKIITDSRYRFERGVDPDFLHTATELATAMIIDLCGGEASEPVVAGDVPEWQNPIEYKPGRAKTLGGVEVTLQEQQQILAKLGFAVEAKDDCWTVTPPSWRPDVEGSADVVEEIVRIVGYDNILPAPVYPLSPLASKAKLTVQNARVFEFHHLFASRGMYGAVTWSFMPDSTAALFIENRPQLFLLNPISADLNYLRPSILPNLIDATKRNLAHGHQSPAFFEIGPRFFFKEQIQQETVATGIRTGEAVPKNWIQPARAADVYDVKADVLAALAQIGLAESDLELTATGPDWYHPGIVGTYSYQGQQIAHFGELSPVILKGLDCDTPVAAFEILMDKLPGESLLPTSRPALPPQPLQPVSRDFAFLVDTDIVAARLIEAVEKSGRPEITHAEVFDVYDGKGIPEGKKSLAVMVTLLPGEKAFTDTELEAISDAILASVKSQTGGELR